MTINYNPEQLLDKLKNEIEPEEQFKKNLRRNILTMAKNSKQQEGQSFMNDTLRKFILAFAAVAAVAVLVVNQGGLLNLSGTKVAARQGFGLLPSLGAPAGAGGQGGERTQSGGGEAAPQAVSTDLAMGFGSGGGGVSGSTGIVVAPDGEYIPPKVTYILETDLPEIPEEIQVLRDNPPQAGSTLIRQIANLTQLDFVSKLSGAQLEHISLRPANSPYGFSLEQFGRFNIWKNQTGEYREIRVEEFPPDAELIRVAEDFLREFNIDTSAYGSPKVDSYWRTNPGFLPLDAQSGTETAVRIAPSYATVYYPMTINGLPAVSWSGDDDPGISVAIDAAHRQGTSINGRWNISRSQSLYPARSLADIEKDALNGGLSPLWGWHGPELRLTAEQEARRQQITARFTQARLGYVQQYKYNQSNGASEVYWIPVVALSGTFTDEAGNEQRYGTIVPAIQSNLFDQPPVQILPAAEPRG